MIVRLYILYSPYAGLLEMFMSRNGGKMPKQIIIYRDGVSDSQFGSIIESELPSIRGTTHRIIVVKFHVDSNIMSTSTVSF